MLTGASPVYFCKTVRWWLNEGIATHWILSDWVFCRPALLQHEKNKVLTNHKTMKEIKICLSVHWYTLFRADTCSLHCLKTWAYKHVTYLQNFPLLLSSNIFAVWIKLLEIKWDTKSESENSHSHVTFQLLWKPRLLLFLSRKPEYSTILYWGYQKWKLLHFNQQTVLQLNEHIQGRTWKHLHVDWEIPSAFLCYRI